MNILFLNSAFPNPEVGGVERQTLNLGNWLSAHGHNVYCLSLCWCERPCGEWNKNSYPFPCLQLPDNGGYPTTSNLKTFLTLQKEYEIDVIVIQSERVQVITLCQRALLHGVKVIAVNHGAPPHKQGDFWHDILEVEALKRGRLNTFFSFPLLLGKYYWNRYHRLNWERKKFHDLYEISSKYLTLSQSYIGDFIDFGNVPDKGRKLTSIPNPALAPSFDYSSIKKEKCILWIGRLTFPAKRPDRILYLWRQFYKHHPDWTLNILGEGDAKPYLQEYCRKFSLGNVFFHGRQPSEPWFQKSSILCMTSSYEGWGLVLTEAMSFGCVPVAYNSYSSLADILTDGENGYCIPPYHRSEYVAKLEYLVEHPSARDRLARNAIESVKKFQMDTIGKKWESLFQQITDIHEL